MAAAELSAAARGNFRSSNASSSELDRLVQIQLALTTPLSISESYLDGQANTIKHMTGQIGELIAQKS